jgi:hypothetical protein
MATYQVTGRSQNGTPLISVHIDAINQDSPIVSELEVVAGVKAYLLTLSGVVQAVAQKQEIVTTNV